MFLYISTKTFWISPIFCGGHPCHPQKSIHHAISRSPLTPSNVPRQSCKMSPGGFRGFRTWNAATKKRARYRLKSFTICFRCYMMLLFWDVIFYVYFLDLIFCLNIVYLLSLQTFFWECYMFLSQVLGVSKKNINHFVGYSHTPKRCLPAVLLKRLDVSFGGCQWMSLAKGCQAALRSGVQYWRLRPIFGYEKLRCLFCRIKGIELDIYFQ